MSWPRKDSSSDCIPMTSPQGYGVVPRYIGLDPSISQAAKLVYYVLSCYVNGEQTCYPSHETIAGHLSMAVSTVQRGLRELRELGVVKWEGRSIGAGQQGSNKYTLLPQPNESGVGHSDRPETSQPSVVSASAGFGGRSFDHAQIGQPNESGVGHQGPTNVPKYFGFSSTSSLGLEGVSRAREERSTFTPPSDDMWDVPKPATPPPTSDDSQRARIFDMPVTGGWWPSKETWDELRPICKHIDPATERLSYAAYCVEKALTPTDEGFKRWAARSEGWALERYNLAASPPLPPRFAHDCDWPN